MKTIGFAQINKMREELQKDLAALTRVETIFSDSEEGNSGGIAVLNQVAERVASRAVGRPRGGVVTSDTKRVPIVQRIEHVVLTIPGQFGFSDIQAPVEKVFPNENFNKSSIPNTLNKLVKEGKLKVVIPKSGRRGAIYSVS